MTDQSKAASDAAFDKLKEEFDDNARRMVASYMKSLYPAVNQIVRDHGSISHDVHLPTLVSCLACFIGIDLAEYEEDEAKRLLALLANKFQTDVLETSRQIRRKKSSH